MDAYFKYVNSRKGPDGKKGVYGRKIVWKYYDDGYNPSNTVQFTHKLVEEDKVFAIAGSLGTEPNLAMRPLPERPESAAAPVSTGAAEFGARTGEQYPWTIGWQPDYIAEGRIYGSGSLRMRRTRRSPSSTRTTTTGRTTSPASRRASGRRRA